MRYLLGLMLLGSMATASAEKIAVATASIGAEYSAIVKDCIDNKKVYCQKHGYDFICARQSFDPARPPAWNKIRVLQSYLGNYDWILWSDADALIMNLSVKLEDLIDNDVFMVLTSDLNGLNTGQFLIKNCPEAFALLEGSYALTQFIHHPWWEQAAIRQYLTDHPDVYAHVKVLPQRALNCYPVEVDADHPEAWCQPGDFILHFPGMRSWDLWRVIQKYKTQVLTGDES